MMKGCQLKFKIGEVREKEFYAICGEYNSESDETYFCAICDFENENNNLLIGVKQ